MESRKSYNCQAAGCEQSTELGNILTVEFYCVFAVIIGVCWVSGSLMGLLPLFGWHRSQPTEGMKCLFTEVMDYDYLVFLYFATIVSPALLMAAFYAHIYRVVLNQVPYL